MKVKDIMVTRFESIRPDTTLGEAAEVFNKGRGGGKGVPPSLLVMEGDRLQGILTLTDLLRSVLPPTVEQDPHLAHLAWDGLLEAQVGRVQHRPVGTIMSRDLVTVRDDAFLTEAAEQLLHFKIHSVPVVREGRVTGILYLSDLAREVFLRIKGPVS